MLALALSLLALTLTPPAPKPPVISPEEAGQHLEQHVIVRGTVSQVVVTDNLTTHVHFGGIYPNQVFTITFFKAQQAEFPGVRDYEGKVVEAEGVIHIARKKPEMLVIRKNQMRVVE